MSTMNIARSQNPAVEVVEQAAAGKDIVTRRGGKPVARLDTHVFIWSVMDSRKLKAATRRYLASAGTVYVSGCVDLGDRGQNPTWMLIAQAFLEPLRLVTADKVLGAYGGAVEFI